MDYIEASITNTPFFNQWMMAGGSIGREKEGEQRMGFPFFFESSTATQKGLTLHLL
jgi:hypothetical protein